MGLFSRILNRFIDIIEWADTADSIIVWKFPRQDNEIKMGAKLYVRESQVAVFMSGGIIADVYGPGVYQLNTQSMPILTTLKSWKPGFNDPFKADVYFISTRKFSNQKWSTQNPVVVRDEELGPVRLRAYGSYDFSIIDAQKFLAEIAATNPDFSTEEVSGQIKNLVVSRGMDSIIASQTPMQDMIGNYGDLSKLIHEKMQPGFTEIGLSLDKYQIENISLPAEVELALDKRRKLDSVDSTGVDTPLQEANGIEKSKENSVEDNPGTTGTDPAAESAMIDEPANDLQQDQPTESNNTAPDVTSAPPPPAIKYFVVLNGKSEGPYSFEELTDMAKNQTINANTLVWKKGMPAWAAGNTIEGVADIFNDMQQ